MAKKKRGKRVVRNVRRSKVSNKKTRTHRKKKVTLKVIHKDFGDFAQRIDRLKSLERELKILDPKGFMIEVKVIKSKLKDPTAINEIERRISALEGKMLNRPKKKSPVKKISRNVSAIRKNVSELSSKVGSLQRNLGKRNEDNLKKFSSLRKNLAKKNDESLKNISSQIRSLKGSFDARQKKEEARHEKDSGVSVLVEDHYRDFMDSLKEDLTREEKKDEEVFKNKLRDAFANKESDLELSYKKKIESVKEEYARRVQLTLDKEVSKKFSEKVNSKLAIERVRLEHNLADRAQEKLSRELTLKKAQLFNQLKKEFDSNFRKKLNEKEAKLQAHKKSFHKTVWDDFNSRLERTIASKEKGLRIKFSKKMNEELSMHVREQKTRLKHSFDARLKNSISIRGKKLDADFVDKAHRMGKQLSMKLKSLEVERQNLISSVQDQKNDLKAQKADFRKRMEGARSKTQLTTFQLNRLKKQLVSEKQLLKKKEDELNFRGANLGKEIDSQKASLKQRFVIALAKEKSSFKLDRESFKKVLSERYKDELRNKLIAEERVLRDRLDNEFTSKMKVYMNEQKAFAQRKLDYGKAQTKKQIDIMHSEIKEKEKKLSEGQKKLEANKASATSLFSKKRSEASRAAAAKMRELDRYKRKLEADRDVMNKELVSLKASEENSIAKIKRQLESNVRKKNSVANSKLKKEMALLKGKTEAGRREIISQKSRLNKEFALKIKKVEAEHAQAEILSNERRKEGERQVVLREKELERKSRRYELEQVVKITEKLHLAMAKELSNKEDELRKRLTEEFDIKTREALMRQRQALSKKKSELEDGIRRKVNALLR